MPHLNTTSARASVPSAPAARPRGGTGGATLARPAALLWDMDGTLVDTEPYWLAAERSVVTEHGLEWTDEDSLQMVGLPLPEAAKVLVAHGVDLPPHEIADRLVASVAAAVRRDLVWQPGARELLAAARDAGIPSALVTMSYRVIAEAVVEAAPPGSFTVTVTGDEVRHGKPHPEPYLRAAELLGVDVTECVAVEDSRPGIASALASGARTLGVQHIVPVEPAPGLSRTPSLALVDLEDLGRIAEGEVLDLMA